MSSLVCNFVMQKKIDDIVNLHHSPSPLTVQVQWGGPQAPQPLAYQTEIDGVIGHDLTVVTPKLCNILRKFSSLTIINVHTPGFPTILTFEVA